MDAVTEEFLSRFLTELREDNAAVFVGAGLSKAAGYVDWRGLLGPIASPLGLDVHKEHDLVGVAQFHLNANSGNRGELNQLLVERFADIAEPTENHKILARLPIRSFWTTNYDRLIEEALKLSGKRVDTKYTIEQLAITMRGRDAVVYKMHGDVEHADKAVLTRDDYEKYSSSHSPFVTALSGDLVERTFLFLGFSFTDPNLDYILSRIRVRFERNQRQHFCIAKRRSRQKDESDEDFLYAKTRQALVIRDLLRFNIKTIEVDEYEHITDLLRLLEGRFRQRTVFVSGSAIEFSPWSQAETDQFLMRLGAVLISRDCRVSSGIGSGIGSSVVTGAVQQIYSMGQRSIEDNLMLRPFPAGINNADERARVYERYRTELMSQAGIAIFVMGNKQGPTGIVKSEGMRLEFDLAKNLGVHRLPVGASGWLSADLWAEVHSNIANEFPSESDDFRVHFKKLGEKVSNPLELIDPIVKLIDLLRRN